MTMMIIENAGNTKADSRPAHLRKSSPVYTLKITHRASQDLDGLDEEKWEKVNNSILSLQKNPFSPEIKLFDNSVGIRRLVNEEIDTSILFQIFERDKTILIFRVKPFDKQREMISLLLKGRSIPHLK